MDDTELIARIDERVKSLSDTIEKGFNKVEARFDKLETTRCNEHDEQIRNLELWRSRINGSVKVWAIVISAIVSAAIAMLSIIFGAK